MEKLKSTNFTKTAIGFFVYAIIAVAILVVGFGLKYSDEYNKHGFARHSNTVFGSRINWNFIFTNLLEYKTEFNPNNADKFDVKYTKKGGFFGYPKTNNSEVKVNINLAPTLVKFVATPSFRETISPEVINFTNKIMKKKLNALFSECLDCNGKRHIRVIFICENPIEMSKLPVISENTPNISNTCLNDYLIYRDFSGFDTKFPIPNFLYSPVRAIFKYEYLEQYSGKFIIPNTDQEYSDFEAKLRAIQASLYTNKYISFSGFLHIPSGHIQAHLPPEIPSNPSIITSGTESPEYFFWFSEALKEDAIRDDGWCVIKRNSEDSYYDVVLKTELCLLRIRYPEKSIRELLYLLK